MPQSGTEQPSPHLRLVASKDRWSGSRTRHRGSQDHPPPAQLTAALHGAGGKTAPTLLLRMTQSGTERPSPHLSLVGSKDRRSGSRTRHRGSQDHPPPAQLVVALHGAGGKTASTLPLRMQRPRTERASPLSTLARGNNQWSGARVGNRGARGTTTPAQLAAALHGAGGKTAPALPFRMK